MKLVPIAPNMTELVLNDGTTVLFSYKTAVACTGPRGTFKTDHRWSNTTSRHISKWGALAFQTKPQAWFDSLVV